MFSSISYLLSSTFAEPSRYPPPAWTPYKLSYCILA